jgi:hypothetical protein
MCWPCVGYRVFWICEKKIETSSFIRVSQRDTSRVGTSWPTIVTFLVFNTSSVPKKNIIIRLCSNLTKFIVNSTKIYALNKFIIKIYFVINLRYLFCIIKISIFLYSFGQSLNNLIYKKTRIAYIYVFDGGSTFKQSAYLITLYKRLIKMDGPIQMVHTATNLEIPYFSKTQSIR